MLGTYSEGGSSGYSRSQLGAMARQQYRARLQGALDQKRAESRKLDPDTAWAYGYAGKPREFIGEILGGQWYGSAWTAWRAFISAVFGEPFEEEDEAAIYSECTERLEMPATRPSSVWMPIGRRGGKSRILAAIAVYLATTYDWSPYLSPGELGVIPVLAADRRQARTIMGYVRAFLDHPRLVTRIVQDQAETVLLSGNIVIEVVTASFRAVRSRTVLAALCVAKGTMIETETGSRPIEDVRAGDRVWTRDGLKPVLKAGMTHPAAEVWRVDLSNGQSLTATPDHPVLVCSQGWTPIRWLKAGDEAVAWPTTASIADSRSTDALTDVGHARLANASAVSTGPASPSMATILSNGTDNVGIAQKAMAITAIGQVSYSIAMSIWLSMARYRRVMRWWSTIRTKIDRTIQSRIWQGLLEPNISMSTPLAAGPVGALGMSDIALGSIGCGLTESRSSGSARSAAHLFSQPGCGQGSVVKSITRLSTRLPVYNLKVAETPEYFANFILTHNCDEIAFWHSEDGSANPDHEIIAALRPAMATIPNALLLGASSPYARRGVLWDQYDRFYGKNEGPLIWKAPTRTMNPSVPEEFIQEKYDEDPIAAAAEYGAEFRSDVDSFVDRDVLDRAMMRDVFESEFQYNVGYKAFCDPSGGSSDSMTLAIGHVEQVGKVAHAVMDVIREARPPFSPEDVVREFSDLLLSYKITRVRGDHYAGEWPRDRFSRCGITYDISERYKSDIYLEFLPILNQGRCKLLDNRRMWQQFLQLERKTARGGHESIDHPPGGHDDVCNVAAGVVVELIGKRDPTDIAEEVLLKSRLLYAPASPLLGTYNTEYSGPVWR